MKRSNRTPWMALIAVAVMSFVPAIGVGTTVMDIELGDVITGDIPTSGVDTVEARFFAAQGAVVKIVLKTTSGSLVPTVQFRDSEGQVLSDGVGTLQLPWLPVRNVVASFVAPSGGQYTAEIGGSSGSGSFWARITGNPATVDISTVSGTVTDSLTGAPIAGANVAIDGVLAAVTDGAGAYSADRIVGSYSIAFSASGFEGGGTTVDLAAGAVSVVDFSLLPLVPVDIGTAASGDTTPGGDVGASVTVLQPAGSAPPTYSWTQLHGPPVTIAGGTTATPTITLPDLGAFRDELATILREPPVTADQLPENVPLPPGEFVGGMQNRFEIAGINPFALERAGEIELEVEVTTEYGTFHEDVVVHADLPFTWTLGLRNVPIGEVVLMNGKEQEGYDWALDPPPGSDTTLVDGTLRHPWFIPDVPGLYELEVTDEDAEETKTIQVFAGTWRGVIIDQDIDGRPVVDTACTLCHNGEDAPDEQIEDWAQTGHAEIFTDNINTSTHYGPNCFPCHTVGFQPGLESGGIDEADDYSAFLGAGLLNVPGDNWTTILEDFPDTARQANIQCENCHGPQDSFAHGLGDPEGEPRASLSSDVCAFCHGEPLRHARFQQWQLSAHANYELAIDESGSGSCSRCHTGNGFLAWLPILLDDDPETDPLASVEVTWTEDEAHPQTCATCHDPHAEGSTTGSNTNATVRISGSTPPLIAGFTVDEAGRGAICMTCHNSRRGLRNDSNFDEIVGTAEAARAPHGSAQTDVLVGQNAYFVTVPQAGGHAEIADSCVECHMSATPPPSVLSYNQGGTNHTFFASETICADCHSPHLQADDVQNSVQFIMDQVEDLMEGSIYDLIDSLIEAGNTVDVNGSLLTDAADIAEIQFGETRGRQAIGLTLTNETEIPLTRLTDVDVIDGGGTVIGILYDFADETLPKAGWNWNLVHNDGSLGVHNPFFATDILIAARDALAAGPGTETTPPPSGRSAISPTRKMRDRETLTRWDDWKELRKGRRR